MAAIAAGLAVWSFQPRPAPLIEARMLRDRYLRAEPRFTRVHLLDAAIRMIEDGAPLVRTKIRRLRAAMTLLMAATALLATGSL